MSEHDPDNPDPDATRRRSDLLRDLEASEQPGTVEPGATRPRSHLLKQLGEDVSDESETTASSSPVAAPAQSYVTAPRSPDACPSCGAAVASTAAYCAHCGLDLAARRSIRGSIKSATVGALVFGLVVAGAAFGIGAATNSKEGSATISSFDPPVTQDYATATTEPYVPSTTSAITSSETPLAAGTAGGYVLTGSDSNGYSSRVTLSVDQPVKVSAAASSSVGRKVAACPVDPNTDALVPVEVQVANTTASFPSVLGMNLVVDSTGLDVATDIRYASGPTCNTPGSSSSDQVFGLEYDESIAPGAAASTVFFLVLHGYYSPNLPSGDTARYDALVLRPTLTFGDTSSDSARRVSPTVTRLGTNAGPIFQMSGMPSSTSSTTTAPSGTGTRSYTLNAELNLRSGPGTSYATLGLVPDGTTVTVQCTVEGEQVDGHAGLDTMWDRVSYQGSTGYLSNGFLNTGSDITDRSKIPHC
jgi:hypothetical protein